MRLIERCSIKDEEAIAKFGEQLIELEKTSTFKSAQVAAQFLFYTGEGLKAKKLLTQQQPKLSLDKEKLDLAAELAWIEMETNKENDMNEIKETFKSILNESQGGNKKHISALLGLAKSLELSKNLKESLSVLNDTVAMFPNFAPPLIEKAKLLIHLNEWEPVPDAIQRASADITSTINCARIQIFQYLARDGNRQLAVEALKEFQKQLDKFEPKNPDLYYKCSQLFARVAGKSELVLQKTMELIKKALLLNPTSSQ